MLLPWIYYLKEREQLLVEGLTRRWTVNGPSVFFARPFWRVQRRLGETLGPTEYLRVRDTLTGELRNEFGPKLYFPTASEEIVEHLSAITLKSNQYIRMIDKRTGAIRVERGEMRSPADKLAIFNTLRKQDAISSLSEGSAQLYFTPSDVNLSIETRQNNRE